MTKGNHKSVKVINQHGPTGFVAFTAFVGALLYFLQFADTFWEVIFAFIKACVWPGFVVYHVLQVLVG